MATINIRKLETELWEAVDLLRADTKVVKIFDSIHITIQNKANISDFVNTISPIMEQINVKMKMIMCSKETRDRLFPKLMSGELDVSG